MLQELTLSLDKWALVLEQNGLAISLAAIAALAMLALTQRLAAKVQVPTAVHDDRVADFAAIPDCIEHEYTWSPSLIDLPTAARSKRATTKLDGPKPKPRVWFNEPTGEYPAEFFQVILDEQQRFGKARQSVRR